jgi:hypothetical protein
MPKQWIVPTIAEAHSDGIDSPESLWQALVDMRDASMKLWPEGIETTLILTHTIWWMSHLKGLSDG